MVLLNEVWPPHRRGLGTAMVQAMAALASSTAAIVAVWALGHFSPDWGWRVALLTGGAPVFLMIYVRYFMPESRLWLAYERRRRDGTLPPEKKAAKTPLVEMLRGASGRYLVLATIAWGAYVIGFQSVSVFMPTLMTRSLGATLEVVRNVQIFTGLTGSAVMVLIGWYSDRIGRKFGVVAPTCIAILAYLGLWLAGGQKYPGSIFAWPLFWCYIVYTLGQSSACMYGSWLSELFIVELRASAVATVYNVGRGMGAISPIVVPHDRRGAGRQSAGRHDVRPAGQHRLPRGDRAAARNRRPQLRRDRGQGTHRLGSTRWTTARNGGSATSK